MNDICVPFDIILCSDLIYGDKKTSHLLSQCIKQLCGPSTLIICAYEQRFAGDQGVSFIQSLQESQFQVWNIAYEHLDNIYRAMNIQVCIISPNDIVLHGLHV